MKEFENPEYEIILFDNDVIASSVVVEGETGQIDNIG